MAERKGTHGRVTIDGEVMDVAAWIVSVTPGKGAQKRFRVTLGIRHDASDLPDQIGGKVIGPPMAVSDVVLSVSGDMDKAKCWQFTELSIGKRIGRRAAGSGYVVTSFHCDVSGPAKAPTGTPAELHPES